MTCKRKATVAMVSLMGDVQTRRDGHGATGGWATCKREGTAGSRMGNMQLKGDGGIMDG